MLPAVCTGFRFPPLKIWNPVALLKLRSLLLLARLDHAAILITVPLTPISVFLGSYPNLRKIPYNVIAVDRQASGVRSASRHTCHIVDTTNVLQNLQQSANAFSHKGTLRLTKAGWITRSQVGTVFCGTHNFTMRTFINNPFRTELAETGHKI